MAILSKGCKPDKFESQNSLKLNFANIRCYCSNVVDCESFHEFGLTSSFLGNRQLRIFFFYYYYQSAKITFLQTKTSNKKIKHL